MNSLQILSSLILTILIILFSSQSVYASDVVINEVFANPEDENNEFIELYNNADHEISIEDWSIGDKVKTFVLDAQTISGKGFLVLTRVVTGLSLNNSDEEITLKDASETVVDTMRFDDTLEGRSWSRIPDGTGAFANDTDVTENAANLPPPSPTPLPTATPTKTPKPTKEPTPTRTPTSSPTPQLSPSPSSRNTSSPSPSVPTRSRSTLATQAPRGTDVKGASEVVASGEDVRSAPPTGVTVIVTGIGLIVLSCGILLYRKYKTKHEEDL